MIVCLCRSVSDRALAGALEAGARSVEEVAQATGAGSSCGCCLDAVEALVRERTPCASPPCPGCPRAQAA